MDLERGTESGGRRSVPRPAASVTVLRRGLERMTAGDGDLPLDELRRHLARAQRNLARVRALGGRYQSVQLSPHTIPLCDLLQARRKAG